VLHEILHKVGEVPDRVAVRKEVPAIAPSAKPHHRSEEKYIPSRAVSVVVEPRAKDQVCRDTQENPTMNGQSGHLCV
jgi:hypothetical protein